MFKHINSYEMESGIVSIVWIVRFDDTAWIRGKCLCLFVCITLAVHGWVSVGALAQRKITIFCLIWSNQHFNSVMINWLYFKTWRIETKAEASEQETERKNGKRAIGQSAVKETFQYLLLHAAELKNGTHLECMVTIKAYMNPIKISFPEQERKSVQEWERERKQRKIYRYVRAHNLAHLFDCVFVTRRALKKNQC